MRIDSYSSKQEASSCLSLPVLGMVKVLGVFIFHGSCLLHVIAFERLHSMEVLGV